MDALTNGSHSDRLVDKKINQYEDHKEELLNSLRNKAEEIIKENLLRLGCLVKQKLKDLAEGFLNSFYEDVHAAVKKVEARTRS